MELAKEIESVITVSCVTSNIKISNSKEDKNKYLTQRTFFSFSETK